MRPAPFKVGDRTYYMAFATPEQRAVARGTYRMTVHLLALKRRDKVIGWLVTVYAVYRTLKTLPPSAKLTPRELRAESDGALHGKEQPDG